MCIIICSSTHFVGQSSWPSWLHLATLRIRHVVASLPRCLSQMENHFAAVFLLLPQLLSWSRSRKSLMKNAALLVVVCLFACLFVAWFVFNALLTQKNKMMETFMPLLLEAAAAVAAETAVGGSCKCFAALKHGGVSPFGFATTSTSTSGNGIWLVINTWRVDLYATFCCICTTAVCNLFQWLGNSSD